MHLISAGKLKQAALKYPDATKTIQAFCKTIKKAQWQNLLDVQKIYRDYFNLIPNPIIITFL